MFHKEVKTWVSTSWFRLWQFQAPSEKHSIFKCISFLNGSFSWGWWSGFSEIRRRDSAVLNGTEVTSIITCPLFFISSHLYSVVSSILVVSLFVCRRSKNGDEARRCGWGKLVSRRRRIRINAGGCSSAGTALTRRTGRQTFTPTCGGTRASAPSSVTSVPGVSSGGVGWSPTCWMRTALLLVNDTCEPRSRWMRCSFRKIYLISHKSA